MTRPTRNFHKPLVDTEDALNKTEKSFEYQGNPYLNYAKAIVREWASGRHLILFPRSNALKPLYMCLQLHRTLVMGIPLSVWQ